jgi:hypothetical protein
MVTSGTAVIQQASGSFCEATRLAQPPGSSGHGLGGSAAVEHQERRAALRDARQLPLNFASAPAYGQTVLAAWSTSRPAWTGSPTPCGSCGTADLLISMQFPRFLAFIPARSSDGSTASAVTRCMTTGEPILCCAGGDTA